MKAKRITAVLLAAALSVTALTGCGINKSATVATFGDGTTVSLGLVNFLCHYQQAYMDDMYTSFYGDNVWQSDLYGMGYTMEQQAKDTVIEQAHELYTLAKPANMQKYGVEITDADKKAISDAAAKFMSGNSKEAIDEMGATQEIVEEMLTLMTISQKMNKVIKAEADTNVSDEEANMRGYEFVEIMKDGYYENSTFVEYSDEEKAKVEDDVKAFMSQLASTDLSSAATYNGYSYDSKAYAADDTSLPEEVKTALDGLKEGEMSDLIDTEDAYYVVRVTAETDADATAKNKESIIASRQDEKYTETLKELQTDDGWKADTKLMEKISFKNHLTMVNPNAE